MSRRIGAKEVLDRFNRATGRIVCTISAINGSDSVGSAAGKPVRNAMEQQLGAGRVILRLRDVLQDRHQVKSAFVTPKFLKKYRDNASSVEQSKTRRKSAVTPSTGIVFDRVTLSRGENEVFKDLNLSLTEKRIGLVGHNGSGKSTLVRALNGLILPDQGKVTVCGLDTARERKALPGIVGFIFQNPDHQIIFPTVEEELVFGLEQCGVQRKEAREKAGDFLNLHNCHGWGGRPVHELSEGQKQLVCVLSVLIMEPYVLILDEPFASLDLPTRLKMIRWIDRLPQQVIVISHELDTFNGYDRVLWVQNGGVFKDGTPDEVVPGYRQAALSEALSP
ncbi:MAG: ABC transporter ATP-binding protein [Stappiaceae bacterium]